MISETKIEYLSSSKGIKIEEKASTKQKGDELDEMIMKGKHIIKSGNRWVKEEEEGEKLEATEEEQQ